MYKKIKLQLNNFDFEKLKGSIVISYGGAQGPVLTYFKLSDPEYFQKLLPKKSLFGISPDSIQLAEIAGAGHLHPHIDHNICTCANYYVATNSSTTYFYNKKDKIEGNYYPGKKVANIFKFEDVDKVDEFVAEQNDCYLLNVSKIHSVDTTHTGVRKFITFQWFNASFDDIVNTLQC